MFFGSKGNKTESKQGDPVPPKPRQDHQFILWWHNLFSHPYVFSYNNPFNLPDAKDAKGWSRLGWDAAKREQALLRDLVEEWKKASTFEGTTPDARRTFERCAVKLAVALDKIERGYE